MVYSNFFSFAFPSTYSFFFYFFSPIFVFSLLIGFFYFNSGDTQVAQYIGETCRYLLAAAPRPEDRQHKIRLMFGNGLRPQIWEEFVKRFNIPKIAEFYGATEGNANISKYNFFLFLL